MPISGLRFLVVEDHGFQRWALQKMLLDLGASEVHAAADGGSALQVMGDLARPVDIVVSDLDMPGMDGLEFIRRVSQSGRAVALILTSSHDRALLSSVEAMARAYGLTLLAAIEKPVTPSKLRAAVEGHGVAAPEPPALPESSFSVAQLAQALQDGRVQAWYQPKVEVPGGRLVGAEALARWIRPDDAVVMPRAFLPDIERGGLIRSLTEAMLGNACADCAAWRAAGIAANVSINLSVASLADLGLVDRLLQIVDAHGLETGDVVLEVTESAAATELAKVLENLSRLRMRGFGLSIDDFGTGYSSMQLLSRVPFTELKIDQSFVLNAQSHPASLAMLESSLEVARKLGITSVAEGVETRREWELVRDLGVDLAQGFYSGRPMALADFLDAARRRISA